MQHDNSVKRLFSLKPVVFIGKISYSLYLFHWLWIAIAHFITGSATLSLEIISIIVVLTFVCAILSYYYLEQPIRHSNLTFKQSLVWLYLLPMVVIIGLNQVARAGVKVRSHTHQAVDVVALTPNPFPKKVASIGDSHAGHLSAFYQVVGLKEGFNVEQLSFPDNIFNIDCYLKPTHTAHLPQCQTQLDSLKPYPVVVISMFYNLKRGIKPVPRSAIETFMAENFEQNFTRMVSDLAKHHKVIVLGDVKIISVPQMRQALLNQYGIGKYLQPLQEINHTEQTNQAIAKMVQGIPNVIYLDPTPYLYQQAHHFMIDGKPLYQDQDHLNKFGAYMMGKTFSENAHFMPKAWLPLVQ